MMWWVYGVPIKEGALGHKRKVERRAWEDLLKTHEMLMTLTVTVAAEEAFTCRGNREFSSSPLIPLKWFLIPYRNIDEFRIHTSSANINGKCNYLRVTL